MICYCILWKHSFCFYTANTAILNNNPEGYSGLVLISVIILRFFMGCTGSFACIMLVKYVYEKCNRFHICTVFLKYLL